MTDDKYDLWMRLEGSKIEFYDDYEGKHLVGSLMLDIDRKHREFLGAVPVFLTPQQTVFSKQSVEMSQVNVDYFASVSLHQTYIPAKFKSAGTDTVRPAYCEFGPYGFTLGGEINGEVFSQIIYQQPIKRILDLFTARTHVP